MQTKKITTPIEKHEVELKDFVTGNDYEEIMKPLNDVKVVAEAIGDKALKRYAEINAGDASRKSTENAIKVVVVSVDGEKKDIVERVGKMHKDDYLFVLKEIDKVYKGEIFTKPIKTQESGID